MHSLETALRYPMANDDWVKTLLVGGLLFVFSFLLFPLLLAYGYLVRVVRGRLDDDPAPPVFDDWAGLFSDGLRAFAVVFAYMLVPSVVAVVTVGGSLLAIATGTRGGAAVGFGGLLLGFLLTAVLTLVFGYAAAAALVNFVREDRLGAAFDFQTLRAVVTTSEYATAWLLSVAAILGAGVVVGALNAIPVLGAVLGAFVVFYAQISATKLWTDGFSAAIEGDDDEAPPAAAEAAV